jgi:Mlc titration factor MtfA (ptsG expression regulator)
LQKRLVALQGLELTPLQSARIALLFCLPVLELGIEWLDGFHEVLIYPAPFVVDDEWEDDIGLVHSQRSVQSGQSWQQGPIVLNWLDIQDSFDASGFNLIVHEVAHKLIPAMAIAQAVCRLSPARGGGLGTRSPCGDEQYSG